MVDTSTVTDPKMNDSKKSRGGASTSPSSSTTSGSHSSESRSDSSRGKSASNNQSASSTSSSRSGSSSGSASGSSFGETEGMAASMNDSGEGFVNHPHISIDNRIDSNARERSNSGFRHYMGEVRHLFSHMREIPNSSRAIFSSVDTHARQNPWMHIGIAGFGALLLGYAFGRGFSEAATSTVLSGRSSDLAAGSASGSMKSGSVDSTGSRNSYERFDDAIDE